MKALAYCWCVYKNWRLWILGIVDVHENLKLWMLAIFINVCMKIESSLDTEELDSFEDIFKLENLSVFIF